VKLGSVPDSLGQVGAEPPARAPGRRPPLSLSTQEKPQPIQFQTVRQCGARTRSGRPCRLPATKKGCCRLHGGASGSGAPSGERNTVMASGPRPRLRSGRNSARCSKCFALAWH